jgi:probable F420-dependent oxidoreductase
MVTFGVSLGRWSDGDALAAAARTAQETGFDVLTTADHLGAAAPFSTLAVAATAAPHVRLRTYVLDAYFWNPALLAREVATLDLLSGGRVELGVGAGHMKAEHDDAGLAFPGVGERWAQVERLVADVRRRLADPAHVPAPVQRPVPVMVAAMGERGLRCAARVADVVGLAGLLQVRGRPPGTFTLASADLTDERAGLVRDVSREHGRSPGLDVLLQHVELDGDPAAAARRWCDAAAAEGADWFTPEMLLGSPFVLLATDAAAAAAELARREQRWGVTCWSTHARSGPALARVLAARAAD